MANCDNYKIRGHTYFLTKGKVVFRTFKGVSEDWELGRLPNSKKVYVMSVIRKVNLRCFGCVVAHLTNQTSTGVAVFFSIIGDGEEFPKLLIICQKHKN